MATPTHLAHRPITSVDDYSSHDGVHKAATDAESLSVGIAQYDGNHISAKVFRRSGAKWSRQSEELPLHRVFDLGTTVLKSILLSADVASPITDLEVEVITPEKLKSIVDYYRQHRNDILPKLRDLKVVLDYFMQEEPKL